MIKTGIYKITNNINKKMYIGQSINIFLRWKEHKNDYKREDTALYRAIRKYGIENFSFEIIEECKVDELDEKEIYYISKYNTYVNAENSNGYNMTLGGGGHRGFTPSDESRRKMSESRKGLFAGEKNPMYGKRGENHHLYGTTWTEERREKTLKAMDGNKHSLKKVICLNDKRVFDSIKIAGEEYGIFSTHISSCCNKKSHSTITKDGKRLVWMHYDEYCSLSNEEIDNYYQESLNGYFNKGTKSVYCVDIDKIFNSITEASKYCDSDTSAITKCCKGKQKTCKSGKFGKVRFKYVEE